MHHVHKTLYLISEIHDTGSGFQGPLHLNCLREEKCNLGQIHNFGMLVMTVHDKISE